MNDYDAHALYMAATTLDDLERTRIAAENRLRQYTRTEPDEDGEIRGFGLSEAHPDVAQLAAMVAALQGLEHDATLQLQRVVRRHPLGPWIKATKGIGEKQGARLIAAIGDPYWNTLHDRPRTVSELWAYSGLHVIPGQSNADTLGSVAGDLSSAGGDSGQPGRNLLNGRPLPAKCRFAVEAGDRVRIETPGGGGWGGGSAMIGEPPGS